jgi:hypothetical protein
MGGVFFESTRSKIFDRTVELGPRASWWDYQWIYSCWINDGLTVAPSKNLVRNIGFSDDATHTTGKHPIIDNLVLNEIAFPLNHPKSKKPIVKADMFISRYWFSVSWKNYSISFLLSLPGMNALNILRKRLFLNEKNY